MRFFFASFTQQHRQTIQLNIGCTKCDNCTKEAPAPFSVFIAHFVARQDMRLLATFRVPLRIMCNVFFFCVLACSSGMLRCDWGLKLQHIAACAKFFFIIFIFYFFCIFIGSR